MTTIQKGDRWEYISIPLCERSVGVEITTDFTLPDYQAEIRRVLCIETNPQPPAKYVGDGAVEFNGAVDIQLTYVGGDGVLCTAPLSVDYSFSVPFEHDSEGGDVSAVCSVYVDNVSARVSSPRRLNLRMRLRPLVRAYSLLPAQIEILAEELGADVYRKTEVCKGMESRVGTSDVIELTHIQPDIAPNVRVVSADASVRVESWEPQGGLMKCKGVVDLQMLCFAEGTGEYSSKFGEIPFEGEIDMEIDEVEREFCRLYGTVVHTSVTVTDTAAECGVGVVLCAQQLCAREIEYVSDIYSVSHECKCDIREYEVRYPFVCENINFTVDNRIPLNSTSIPEDAKVIRCFGNSRVERCENIGGHPAFFGNMNFTVIYESHDEISVAELTVPVKYESDTAVQGEIVSFDGWMRATDVKLKIADGTVNISAESEGYVDCLGENTAVLVENVAQGEELSRRKGEIIVCYPAVGDTLWSVAKRYKVAPGAVMGDPQKDSFVMIG